MSILQEPSPGSASDEFCPFCGTRIPPRGYYCPVCGAVRPSMAFSGVPPPGDRRAQSHPIYPVLAQPKKSDLRAVVKAVTAFAMLTLVADVLLSLYTLVYGARVVVPDILNSWEGYTFFIILPVMVPLFEVSGTALAAYYFLLIAIIFASCLWVLFTSLPGFAKELSMKAKPREHSPLFETSGLVFATLFLSVVVALIARPSEEELPDLGTLSESLFLLANASVWEELAVRVLLIGVPMMVVDLIRRSLRKDWYAYILGGGFELGALEVALLVFSSVMFGFAHYAGGWGAWKILPTTVGGLAMGYLFLRYGLATAIMLHFTTDYLSMPGEVFHSTALTALLGLAILLWLGFGALLFAYYTVRVIEFVTNKKFFEGGPRAVPAPWIDPRMQTPVPGNYPAEPNPNAPLEQPLSPPSSFAGGGGYVCPRCGNTTARWVDGRFQCLKCGWLT